MLVVLSVVYAILDIYFLLILYHVLLKVLEYQTANNLAMSKKLFANHVLIVIFLLMINQLVLTKTVLMEFQTVINI